ncbi:hypothetical protein Tco_0958079, partial [Tanacetum coccineum]
MNQILERVDQSPSDELMIRALDPVIEALIAKELLGHLDIYGCEYLSCMLHMRDLKNHGAQCPLQLSTIR